MFSLEATRLLSAIIGAPGIFKHIFSPCAYKINRHGTHDIVFLTEYFAVEEELY